MIDDSINKHNAVLKCIQMLNLCEVINMSELLYRHTPNVA